MHLTQVRIRNFRCLERVDLQPEPSINAFIGDNGSGKSSLLEALLYLSRARSFRTASSAPCVRLGCSSFSIVSSLQDRVGREYKLGLTHGSHQTRIKLAGDTNTTVPRLARSVPMHLVDPGIHRISEEGPHLRRQFLDWGVFHVEHRFYSVWKKYKRVLLQRNTALKSHDARNLAFHWDRDLLEFGSALSAYRHQQVKRINTIFSVLARSVLKRDAVVEYKDGWPDGQTLEQAIASDPNKDIQTGFTRYGPHRADLKLCLDGRLLKKHASRGEQKTYNILLSLAQATAVGESTGETPIFLLDDMAAEMGESLREKMGEVLSNSGLQLFITALNPDLIPDSLRTGRMFHVEHGVLDMV